MSTQDKPLDADDLIELAGRAAQLPAADAEWVGHLLQELLRARTHEAELLAEQASFARATGQDSDELDDHLVQVALDTAEWLRTLWNVGYMGAGSFRSRPRSAFPAIDLEDVRKSSLFARIRQGKHVLPFPPPTRHGLPWHALLENSEQAHAVTAEIIRDETGLPLAAIIEGCAEWNIITEPVENRECLVQHQGKGPTYRLRLADDDRAELRREAPTATRRICLEGRSGFRSYTLEWPQADGQAQFVALRAATWERAEAEAEHWLASTHPELYGQIRFERCED
ncbi:conserved hypothetical protein [Candidatus Accumulibacter aalborgensis]|uniref:Uncharacterized protein n=1 Tax=Candidatus Accumulibacter aalborgensis TaxID=1860102 RepID=A0A1A8XHJ0_9PROT|nr:hypothetical protein [Candidatus Accumulibacter aalborgensis]SBT03408.1 conserved hypothetical protein [Candidatus Accumulibacter aalborgensis]